MANKVSVLIDVATDKATQSMKNLTKEMRAADTVTGKFKVGAKGAFEAVKNNASEFALVAGAAVVAFGVKSVKAFQDTALAPGKFADATGTSVEEASRLKEVAEDIGIELGTVQGAMQRFNKAAADGEVFVEGFGNAVVKASDGTVDSYQSFINAASAIGAIEDPTKRAEAAQETFGRSYGEIAELMEMDAADLRAALDGVSDAKVIDDEKLRKARDFRDAMDRLNGVVEDLQHAFGELIVENADLVDGLAANVEMVVKYSSELGVAARAAYAFVSPLQAVREATGFATEEFAAQSATLEELNQWLDDHGASAEETQKAIEGWTAAQQAAAKEAVGLTDAVEDVDRSAQDFAEEAADAAAATRDMERALDDTRDAASDLMGSLDQEEKWQTFNEAVWNFADGSGDAAEEMRDWKKAAADLIVGLEGMPEEQKTALLLEVNEGDKATVDAVLFKWQQGINVPVRFKGQGDVGFMKNARGTPPGGSPGGLTLVGEEGPELVEMPKGAHVTPAGETARLLSGATSGSGQAMPMSPTHVTNNYIQTAADPNAVVKAIKQYERLNGKGWRS